jgi:hypothetical protein
MLVMSMLLYLYVGGCWKVAGCSGSSFVFSSGFGVIIIGGDSRLANIALSSPK